MVIAAALLCVSVDGTSEVLSAAEDMGPGYSCIAQAELPCCDELP